ncbi:MAG: hypothetical protein JWQ96_1465 [Segetibacter sp.]|nr:hypothetical protein [Segetibacter sp.]
MKRGLLVSIGLFISICSFSQRNNYYVWPIDTATKKIVFTEAAYLLNADAATILNAASSFLTRSFRNPNDSVFIDSLSNTVYAKASYNLPVEQIGERGKGYVSFDVTIWCNKNWYKYSFTNFQHLPATPNDATGGPLENEKAISGYQFPKKYWDELKAKAYYRIQTTIEGLKETILKNNK